jgi:hypothetical protein
MAHSGFLLMRNLRWDNKPFQLVFIVTNIGKNSLSAGFIGKYLKSKRQEKLNFTAF